MLIQKESIPLLLPAAKLLRVVRGWIAPPPVKERSEPVPPEDDSDLLESLGITPLKDMPPPPTPPPVTVVSVLRGPLNPPSVREKSERVHPESGGGKLASLAPTPMTFLCRLIKLVSGFLSKSGNNLSSRKSLLRRYLSGH